jgi:XRE family aerobic/anaerobic benzoate catabolism transcriptional regulator
MHETRAPDDVALLARVGGRARELRRAHGATRKEIARRAGLSERFLATVESGAGNPSLLSLAALARALSVDLPDLIGGSWPGAPRVPAARRAPRVLTLLGLRGAGKTTIGAAAAARLGVTFVELDAAVERDAGLAAGELFELHGAAYYRRLEREALDRVIASGPDAIVATTGGMVTDHAALERALAATTAVWLRARPEDHFRRVMEQGDMRPMQNRDRAMEELRAILRARRALYERAHHVVDTSRLGLERSVERVVKIARGLLAS